MALPSPPRQRRRRHQQKKVKDQGEFEIYNEAIKDAATIPRKTSRISIPGRRNIRTPISKTTALYMYMQAYSKSHAAAAAESDRLRPAVDGERPECGFPRTRRGAEYPECAVPGGLERGGPAELPRPDQLALGEKAARQLLDFAPKYFMPENKPADMTPRMDRGANGYREAHEHRAGSDRGRAGQPGAGEERLRDGGIGLHQGAQRNIRTMRRFRTIWAAR